MVDSVKETFTDLVVRSSCSWFESWNVPAAKRKLEKMKLYTAYPIWLKDKNKLAKFYDGVRATRIKYEHFQKYNKIIYLSQRELFLSPKLDFRRRGEFVFTKFAVNGETFEFEGAEALWN
jgi:hypothetical protein